MNGSRGFTLLELMIGMALLGFILALLFGGFRLAARSWDAVEERAERSADEQAARALVRNLVANAQPLHLKRATDTVLAFEGGAQGLRLLAPLGQIGLQAIELAIEPDDRIPNMGSSWRLVLRHDSLRYQSEDVFGGFDDHRRRLLLGGLQAAAFSYYGAENRGDAPQWHDQWSNTNGFPLLVRLRLAPRNARPLDLDVSPMISGDRLSTMRITPGPR